MWIFMFVNFLNFICEWFRGFIFLIEQMWMNVLIFFVSMREYVIIMKDYIFVIVWMDGKDKIVKKVRM